MGTNLKGILAKGKSEREIAQWVEGFHPTINLTYPSTESANQAPKSENRKFSVLIKPLNNSLFYLYLCTSKSQDCMFDDRPVTEWLPITREERDERLG